MSDERRCEPCPEHPDGGVKRHVNLIQKGRQIKGRQIKGREYRIDWTCTVCGRILDAMKKPVDN